MSLLLDLIAEEMKVATLTGVSGSSRPTGCWIDRPIGTNPFFRGEG